MKGKELSLCLIPCGNKIKDLGGLGITNDGEMFVFTKLILMMLYFDLHFFEAKGRFEFPDHINGTLSLRI